jgi:hypothetical protein
MVLRMGLLALFAVSAVSALVPLTWLGDADGYALISGAAIVDASAVLIRLLKTAKRQKALNPFHRFKICA